MIGGTEPEHIHARAEERESLQKREPPGPELVIEQLLHTFVVRRDLLPGRTHVSDILKKF